MQYTKPPLTIKKQIELLKSRDLVFGDEAFAEDYLSKISYYRLSPYMQHFQSNDGKHIFSKDTTFEDIVDVYNFDSKLRKLVFRSIEQIEIKFRCQIIYNYALAYGSHWFLDIKHFRRGFTKFMSIITDKLSKNNAKYIAHYKKKYTIPTEPPCWMIFEVLTLGENSITYKNLKLSNEKKEIAKSFNVNYNILESWIEALTYIRNICAHHSLLWNLYCTIKPMIPKSLPNDWLKTNLSNEKVFFILSVMLYLNPGSDFVKQFDILLTEHSNIPLAEMGFPHDWKNEVLWKL